MIGVSVGSVWSAEIVTLTAAMRVTVTVPLVDVTRSKAKSPRSVTLSTEITVSSASTRTNGPAWSLRPRTLVAIVVWSPLAAHVIVYVEPVSVTVTAVAFLP